MRLEFNGVVQVGDECRVGREDIDGAVLIGGVDVVDEVAEKKWGADVCVVLNGEQVANGHCVSQVGWGYSEYTPIESDKVDVGECNLIARLIELDGQNVSLLIFDSE